MSKKSVECWRMYILHIKTININIYKHKYNKLKKERQINLIM